MLIGAPREIKSDEYRVGLVPSAVRELCAHGHEVVVESQAGAGVAMLDEDYERAGARILPDAKSVFDAAEMIVKVKEPQPEECRMLREGQVLFTYLHLAPDPEQARQLQESGCIAVAYETVTAPDGTLPLLAPMSEVAGRLAVQAGAHCLEKEAGGCGVLLGGVPGVRPAHVVVIGGGVVGTNAVRIAIGNEAFVTVIDKSLPRLQTLDFQFGGRLNTIYSTQEAIEEYVSGADLVIGAVLVPGAAAPRLITRAMIGRMRRGTAFVDVAIDQGGCSETSKATTHSDPTYVVDEVVHYCVANMPGAVPRTSALALKNATLPFVLDIAGKGVKQALLDDPGLLDGLNVNAGQITYQAVADALGLDYTPAAESLG
jgi:alanine dehydrogenase